MSNIRSTRNIRKVFVTALMFAAALAGAAWGSVTVSVGDDSGPGSLRQAILAANAGGDTDIIVDPSVPAISVRSEISITSGITLNGNGVALEGAGSSRLFRITDGHVKFDSVTFTGGAALSGNGGAVEVDGGASAEFNNCTFFNNSARDAGGAVCVTSGALTRSTVFRHCTVAGNGAVYGGGVAVLNGTLTLLFSIAVGNDAPPYPGGGGSAGPDVWQDSSGAVNGSWNVVGGTNSGASFTSAESNLMNQTAASVFLTDPPELDEVDGVRVLKLAGTSPARDRIPASTPEVLTVDERGAARPQLSGVDAGAFEVSPVAIVSADLTGAAYIVSGQAASYDVAVYPLDASLDDSAYPGGIEWVAADSSVLRNDGNGRFTALAEGVTTVTAIVHGWDALGNGITVAAMPLTVRTGAAAPVVTVVFDPLLIDREVRVNATETVTPTVRTTLNGVETPLPYVLSAVSGNPGVASVDVVGDSRIRIAGRTVGTSDISVTATVDLGTAEGAFTDTFAVTVTEQKSSGGGSGGGCDAHAGAASGGLALLLAASLLRRGRRRDG